MPSLADERRWRSVGRRPAFAANARRDRARRELGRRPRPRPRARDPCRRRRPLARAARTRRSACGVYLGGERLARDRAPARAAAPRSTRRAASPACCPTSPATGGSRTPAAATLALRSGRYDETPLDCGRAGCHPAITDAVAASPMTTVLRAAHGRDAETGRLSGLRAGLPHDRRAGRARRRLFARRVRAGHRRRSRIARWDALPRDLHRLGGVGCLACHGPGAIPEASARWSILRTDVCAVCHDAPPRYGHVVAWRQSAMARADQDPRARTERACARCHTTAGFLAAVSPPERAPVDRRAPGRCRSGRDHVQRLPRRSRSAPARRHGPPAAIDPGARAARGRDRRTSASRATRPDADDARPSASAAAIWRGRGGLDPATGQPLTGGAPHAAIAGGCVGCHRGGPDNLERGSNHAFRAPASVCTTCHPQGPPPATDLRARARQLWRGVQTGESGRPAHAGDTRVDRRTPRGRAIWDLLLVLEDPAAAAHNARYAGALLDAAESVLQARRHREHAAMIAPLDRLVRHLARRGCARTRPRPRLPRPRRRRRRPAPPRQRRRPRPRRCPPARAPADALRAADGGRDRRLSGGLLQPPPRRPVRPRVLAARQLRRLPRLREPEGQGGPREQPAGIRAGRVPGRPGRTTCASRSDSHLATCRATVP